MGSRERLEHEIDDLKKKLDRCFERRLLTDDPVREINLERLENKLEAQLKEKERELNQLADTALRQNRKALDLEEGLCDIDFDQAKAMIRASVKALEDNEGGSALFLMERCLEREGQLLLKSLKDILGTHTKEYKVEFIPTMPANELTFLKILGGHFGLEFEDSLGQDAEKRLLEISEDIVGAIAHLLRSGTTVLIPLANWRILGVDYQVTFLDWFMKTFWQQMVRSVNEVMEDYSPKVFFVIVVDNELSELCQQADYFGEGSCLDCNKIERLPLTCWNQADIKRWLASYAPTLKKSDRNALVKKYIFNGKKEDEPIKIRKAVEEAHAKSYF
ncbi:MAG: hypothetical protein AAGC93_20945 [Cyanobacteria bacterium P01_F01_bin.53]